MGDIIGINVAETESGGIIVNSRNRRGTKPSARGHNWVTLFLGDINTGTWPSRLGEYQMRQ
jgi:hypothetical protein